MRLDIVLDFGYCNIIIWHKCCLLLVLKAALQCIKLMYFSELTRLFQLFYYLPFPHLDITSTLQVILYLKSKFEDILLMHQLSTLEYRCNIDSEVFGQKYSDIGFSPYPPALAGRE